MVKLDNSAPLSLQLYRWLRGAILTSKLQPGKRLPSTRTLATDAGVSRNTVLLAYDQLIGEGYAVGRRGSGTYVPAELPDEMTSAVRFSPARRAAPSAAGARALQPRLSRFGKRIQGWDASWSPRAVHLPYDFRYGRPGLVDFPDATWNRVLARRGRRASAGDHDYSPPGGATALRESLADYLQRARAVVCTPEQIVIVNGSQQGLDIAARVLLDPRDRVLLEEPHYAGARGVFAAAGAKIITVPVEADGLDICALGVRARDIRLAYVTPSHQFPTGAVMSLSRRLALLAWAERADAYVLEDDYDSEYRYAGRPIESLQGLDRSGRVIYVGTFSKLMFPALRLGYLVLPEPLVKPFLTAKALADTGSATLMQLALADFIREGHFERHIRRSRARNAARRADVLDAIAEYLGDRIEVSGANAGVHLLLWLRGIRAERVDALIERAATVGVGVYSVAPYYLKPPKRAGLLLGYASLSREEIRTGIRRLAGILAR